MEHQSIRKECPVVLSKEAIDLLQGDERVWARKTLVNERLVGGETAPWSSSLRTSGLGLPRPDVRLRERSTSIDLPISLIFVLDAPRSTLFPLRRTGAR